MVPPSFLELRHISDRSSYALHCRVRLESKERIPVGVASGPRLGRWPQQSSEDCGRVDGAPGKPGTADDRRIGSRSSLMGYARLEWVADARASMEVGSHDVPRHMIGFSPPHGAVLQHHADNQLG